MVVVIVYNCLLASYFFAPQTFIAWWFELDPVL